MSRTFRRMNFEKTSRSKPGSSISGFYTVCDIIPKENPNEMMKRPVYEYDPFLYSEHYRSPKGFLHVGWEETRIPSTKWVDEYRKPTEKERSKLFWKIHKDSHLRWGPVGKITRKIEEKKFRSQIRNSISRFYKNQDDVFIPKFPVSPLD